jgi:alpha-N-acetylglucosaminidase
LGNINYFDGPLPTDWIDQHRLLQRQILGRMRDLGITPIVPGFSGFVPQGFKRVNPEAKTYTEMWHSKEMPRQSKTFILDPGAANLYKDIGKKFIQEYKQEFGPAKYYLVDTFNELSVPVSEEHRYEELTRFARSVFEGIIAGDPDGVWVMEGWLFRDNPKFWDDKSVGAFLSEIPNDRLIILDYSNDSNARNKNASLHPTDENGWKQHKAYHGKQWINGMIHTFGGNNNVKGNLPLIAAQPSAVLESSTKGKLIGWSMNPEGIQTNEVVYELMTDVGWSSKEIHLDSWIVAYCRARYGACPPAMKDAWELFIQSAYGWHTWNSRHSWQCRPSLEPAAVDVDTSPTFGQGVERFLSCSDQLMSSELYRNDLIEFVSQSVGGSIDLRLREACEAHKNGNYEHRELKSNEALAMLMRVDGLVNLRQDRRLEEWTKEARSWGATEDIKAYYDENARRLITFWGWTDLNDYASRVWSGLIRDYYVGRWRVFFAALQENTVPDLDIWEETWLSTPFEPSVPLKVDDIAAEARRMLVACSGWS